ncbi:MAG TPA: hypothetical protein VNQ79_24815 [Blastocatellia bacterium]|nr:hypothetical protein [Blastocatellia bacterium]
MPITPVSGAQHETDSYAFALSSDEPVQIDAAPLIRAVAADVLSGVAVPVIASRFHNAVAGIILQLALTLREREKLSQVALMRRRLSERDAACENRVRTAPRRFHCS